MTPLAGLGIWIWELDKCERGNLAVIAAKAKACGVSHVIVKAGEEATNGQVTPALVATLRGAGIECAAWWYSRPTAIASQCALLEDLVQRCGVRHIVQDAEKEWDTPDQRPLGAELAQRIRQAIGADCYFADAAWARPALHGGYFPYAEFGGICNARSPQLYWQLAKPDPCGAFLAQADAEWAKIAPAQLICPTGSPVDYTGAVHAPLSETAAFLDRYAGGQSCSLWSWQHLSTLEWQLLATRARAATAIVGELVALEGEPPPTEDGT